MYKGLNNNKYYKIKIKKIKIKSNNKNVPLFLLNLAFSLWSLI